MTDGTDSPIVANSGSRQSAVTLLREMARRSRRRAEAFEELAKWAEESPSFGADADEALWTLAIGFHGG